MSSIVSLRVSDFHPFSTLGIQELECGDACSAVLPLHSCIVSGHYDKHVKGWDQRSNEPCFSLNFQRKIKSLDKYPLGDCFHIDTL